jgi:hypothetical protein
MKVDFFQIEFFIAFIPERWESPYFDRIDVDRMV